MPHRLVGVMVYQLPFGSKGAYPLGNRALRGLLGDWQIGSVISLQSGMPFAISGASDGAMVARPDRVPGQALEVPKELQRWYDGATSVTLPCGRVVTPTRNTFLKYNACAFRGEVVQMPNGSYQPDQFWVGNSAQNIGNLRGPGRFNVDMSLRRTFQISERVSLNIVADATNLSNSTQLNGNYNGALGGTNLVSNPSRGLVPGLGLSDTFGTIGIGRFDPRQVTMRALIRF